MLRAYYVPGTTSVLSACDILLDDFTDILRTPYGYF